MLFQNFVVKKFAQTIENRRVNLTLCGWHDENNHIWLLYYRTCKKRFSERKGMPLFGLRLPNEKFVAVLKHIC